MAPAELAEKVDRMSDEEFERYTLAILSRELGAYGFARFLRTCRTGSGDYTRDRHQWLDGLTVEDALRDVSTEAKR
jgi:hypothetical protein